MTRALVAVMDRRGALASEILATLDSVNGLRWPAGVDVVVFGADPDNDHPASEHRFAHYPVEGLGTARCTNIAIEVARSGGYDVLLVLDAGVRVPANGLTHAAKVLLDAPAVSALHFWPDRGATYAMLPADAAARTADQDVIDVAGEALARHFGPAAIDIVVVAAPAVCYQVARALEVGPLDVTLSDASAHSDWGLRARARGYSASLAPGCPAQVPIRHAGSSELDADADAILDHRYPLRLEQSEAMLGSGIIEHAAGHAMDAILRAAALRWGWSLGPENLDPAVDDRAVRCVLDPADPGLVHISGYGLTSFVRVDPENPSVALDAHFAPRVAA